MLNQYLILPIHGHKSKHYSCTRIMAYNVIIIYIFMNFLSNWKTFFNILNKNKMLYFQFTKQIIVELYIVRYSWGTIFIYQYIISFYDVKQ